MENSLAELQPLRQKKAPLLKARSGGWFEKVVIIGGGVCVVYTAAATAPIAAGAAILAMGVYLWEEAKGFQSRELSENLDEILNARTPRHPSINELRTELKRKYPVTAINTAIESMIGHCEIVYFKPSDKHPLAVFGSAYCWVNPDDLSDVKLPLQRMEELFKLWGIIPTQDTQAVAIESESAPIPALPPATTAAPTNTDNEPLIERLLLECPELLKLIKAPPVRLVGAQRTGKSSLARILVLLRLLLIPGHKAAWATPHRESDNPLPSILNPVGVNPDGRKDFAAIESLWTQIQNQIDHGIQLNKTVTWDEFGSYDNFEDLDLLGKSLRSLLRESSKHGYFPILIAHGDQASFYPGVSNILTTLKSSTVKVETVGEQSDLFGTMKPTGKFTVQWLDGSTSEGQLPSWLTEQYLLELLAGKATVTAATTPATTAPTNPTPEPEPDTQLQQEATQLQADSEVATEPHEAVEAEAETEPDNRYQIVRRVGMKIAEKLAAANGDWVNVNSLIRDAFSQPNDREVARAILKTGVENGRLESQEKENPNKTTTVMVRIKNTDGGSEP